MTKIDRDLAARIASYREHPARMVREMFGVEPDAWQEEALEAFPHQRRMALQACKGPGKTAVLSWLSWNFLLTRPFPKCAATSISGDNLADNFWTEMAHWQQKAPFLRSKFTWTKTRIFANDHPETWFMSARTWPKNADANQQADTLAGLHADYILFILDESGGIPDAVMASAEAALSSCIEGHLVQAGNPTALAGPLYRAATSEKHLWWRVEITGDPDDPKRSPRVSVEWAREQIEKWGRDHPYVLVNIFAKFPPASFNALIGPDEVDAAMNRYYREYDLRATAKVLGIDVALYGDDASSIARRQGLQAFPFQSHRNIDGIAGGAIVNRIWNEWGADACFVDGTGGFGATWIDNLRLLGKSPISVNYSSAPHNKGLYKNKRAEMYFDLVFWIRRGGALPKSERLKAALTNTTYTAPKGLTILEPKEFIKVKIGHSPDEADALAQTFAEEVSPRAPILQVRSKSLSDYNPFASMNTLVQDSYDPFRSP